MTSRPTFHADERVVGGAATIAAVALALWHGIPDLHGKPLHSDEAVSGLVAVRPFLEALGTGVGDRGGPPFHYLLAHVALWLEPTATALRALSLVLTAAAIPIIFDFGRRLAGPLAGGAAALLASFAPLLQIYASFGRPYALFIFTTALALDLFARALERRTLSAAMGAAAAAALVPATHTFGFYLVVAEAIVGLAVWQLRPVRGLVVAAAGATLLVPALLAAQRISERFSVRHTQAGAQPDVAARQVFYAVMGSSGGRPAFWLFAALALVGLIVVVRARPSVGALAVMLVLAPPTVFLILSIRGGARLEAVAPRHLVFLLPLWTVLVAVGFRRLARAGPAWLWPLGIAVLAVAAAVAPLDGVFDPRTRHPGTAASGSRAALRDPVTFLRSEITPTDVLYPHSQAFLAALPATRRAFIVLPGAGQLVERAFGRVRFPVAGVVVAVPFGPARVDRLRLDEGVGPADAAVFDHWTIVRVPGPFTGERAALRAIAAAQEGVAAALAGPTPSFEAYFSSRQGAVCRRLRELGETGGPCRRGGRRTQRSLNA